MSRRALTDYDFESGRGNRKELFHVFPYLLNVEQNGGWNAR